jgi:hypothetical protein
VVADKNESPSALLLRMKNNRLRQIPTIKQNIPTTVFPIHEYWLDNGHDRDLEKTSNDYIGLFCND